MSDIVERCKLAALRLPWQAYTAERELTNRMRAFHFLGMLPASVRDPMQVWRDIASMVASQGVASAPHWVSKEEAEEWAKLYNFSYSQGLDEASALPPSSLARA